VEAGELGLDPADALPAARLVAFGLGRVVADDEALRGVAVADVDFLDAQGVADLAVAAGARQRLLGLGHPGAQLHAGDVVPAGRAQVTQVALAREAGVDDVDRPAEPPAGQIVLDLLDDRLVVGVARPHPAADRDPLPGDREADHDLGQVGAVVLEGGITLHHVRSRLPAEVRIVAAAHPFAGRVLRARHVYRRYGRLWLVVVLADGGVASVAVEDTDVLSVEPVVAAPADGTVLSREGARRLIGLIDAVRRRTVVEDDGPRDRGGDGWAREPRAAR
jgi:hypothetical protein